jgi:hypothetical protein
MQAPLDEEIQTTGLRSVSRTHTCWAGNAGVPRERRSEGGEKCRQSLIAILEYYRSELHPVHTTAATLQVGARHLWQHTRQQPRSWPSADAPSDGDRGALAVAWSGRLCGAQRAAAAADLSDRAHVPLRVVFLRLCQLKTLHQPAPPHTPGGRDTHRVAEPEQLRRSRRDRAGAAERRRLECACAPGGTTDDRPERRRRQRRGALMPARWLARRRAVPCAAELCAHAACGGRRLCVGRL